MAAFVAKFLPFWFAILAILGIFVIAGGYLGDRFLNNGL